MRYTDRMKTFRRTPARELPRALYYRHLAILAGGGLVLIIAALVFCFNLTWATEMREAQQDAVAVQMAICRAGEEQVGLGHDASSLYYADTGELTDDFEKEVKSLSRKNGQIRLYALNDTGTDASKLTYDTENYHVYFDENASHMWTVTCKSLPFLVVTY